MPTEFIDNKNSSNYYEMIKNYDEQFLEVKFKPVDFIENCLPTFLEIFIEFFQKDHNLKNIVNFNIFLKNYTDCIKSNDTHLNFDRNYEVQIHFKSLGYIDLLNKYQFSIPIYIGLYLFIGSIFFLIIVLIWAFSNLKSNLKVVPPLYLSKYIKFAVWPAFKGYFYSIVLLIILNLTIFVLIKSNIFLNFTLNWSDFYTQIDINTSLNHQIKRVGLYFFITSCFLFYLTSEYLIPIPKNENISEEHAEALDKALNENDRKDDKSQIDSFVEERSKFENKSSFKNKSISNNKQNQSREINTKLDDSGFTNINKSLIDKENEILEDSFIEDFDIILETIISLTWKRRYLILKYFAFTLILVIKTEFSLSQLFNRYVYYMVFLITTLDFILEEFVLNFILKDALLAAPIICIIKLSTVISFIGVDEFKIFLSCYFIKLLIRIPKIIFFLPVFDYLYEIINHKIFSLFIKSLQKKNYYKNYIFLKSKFNLDENSFENTFDKANSDKKKNNNNDKNNLINNHKEKLKNETLEKSNSLKSLLIKERLLRILWKILNFLTLLYFENIHSNYENYIVFVNMYIKKNFDHRSNTNSLFTRRFSTKIDMNKDKLNDIVSNFIHYNKNTNIFNNKNFIVPKPSIFKKRANSMESIHRCLLTFSTDITVSLMTPIFLLIMLFFEKEIQLTSIYDITTYHFIHYIIFTLCFMFFEILYLIFMYNSIELIFGFRLREYLTFCHYRYSIRSSSWVNMRENLDLSLGSIWRNLDAMLYCEQFYLILFLTTAAGILLIFSIGMMVRFIYNPFGDPIIILAILLFIGLYLIIDFVLQRFKKIFGIWSNISKSAIFTAEEGKFLEFLNIKPSLKNMKKFMKTDLFRHKFLIYNKNFIVDNLDKLLKEDVEEDNNLDLEGDEENGFLDKNSTDTFLNKTEIEKINYNFKDIYQKVVNYDAIDKYIQVKKNQIKKELQILPNNQKIKGEIDEVYKVRLDISDDISADEPQKNWKIPHKLKYFPQLKKKIKKNKRRNTNYWLKMINIPKKIGNFMIEKKIDNSINFLEKQKYTYNKDILYDKNNNKSLNSIGITFNELELNKYYKFKKNNEEKFLKEKKKDFVFFNKKSNQFMLKFCLLTKIWLGKAKEIILFKKWSLELLRKIINKNCEKCKSTFNLHVFQKNPINNIIHGYKNQMIGKEFSKVSWLLYFEKNQKFITLCMECSYLQNVIKKDKENKDYQIKVKIGKLGVIDKELRNNLKKPHVRGILFNWLFEARSNLLINKIGKKNN